MDADATTFLDLSKKLEGDPRPAGPSLGGWFPGPQRREITGEGSGAGMMLRLRYIPLMTLGVVFLESVASGVITEQEIAWVTGQQSRFARHKEALAIRLGRLLDDGQINLGCRISGSR